MLGPSSSANDGRNINVPVRTRPTASTPESWLPGLGVILKQAELFRQQMPSAAPFSAVSDAARAPKEEGMEGRLSAAISNLGDICNLKVQNVPSHIFSA